MAGFDALTHAECFKFTCECFSNDPNLQIQKLPGKTGPYVKQEKKRCNSFIEKVYEHRFFDFEEMKPCHGVTRTHAYYLRDSYQRHIKSINRLVLNLKKIPVKQNDIYIKFGNGKRISVSVYAQTMKADLIATKNKIQNFAEYWEPVCIDKFSDSERSHLNTLKVLENVFLQSSADGTDQLEISLDSSI